ncbi:C4-dicarboxylate transporter DctA [Aquirhabdus parva]|uniref:C4-dicarboxylate transporter DctA n=1 Tax=Aquirhabdus parva TaxID=2283318 RepID=A0A345P888_9GAMM|nr:C4-dicarboxylate transporter DctA [Aquirhabdus parva]AXI03497.1 C4-dicarboxylate transporter DctA [Aquirhabdus parva]
MPTFIKKSLFIQVLFALIVGVIIGVIVPDLGLDLKPLGDGFIKLIKMIVAPIVFCVVVLGIYGAGNLKKVGRVGGKTILYFEVVTTVALALGLLMAFVLKPGVGMNINTQTLDGTSMATYVERTKSLHSVSDYLLNIIPSTVVDAFAQGDILQVLLIALLFGAGMSMICESAKPVADLLESLSQILFRIMGMIIKLAPLGVLGAIAYTTAKYGVASLKQLGMLVLVFYISCISFIVVILGLILKLVGFNIFKLIGYLREELLIVLGTASSDAVLPQIMRKLTQLGIKESTVGLVIPTGYSFNLDGFSIYLSLAVVFIAQATNTPLSMHDLGLILLVSLLTSKGAHGIPGSAIVILAATLSAIPAIPAIGLVLILSIDWFVGIARALTNLIGNCAATVVIAVWERDIDRVQAQKMLDAVSIKDLR